MPGDKTAFVRTKENQRADQILRQPVAFQRTGRNDLVAGFVEESVAPDTPLTLDDLADVVSGEQSVIPDLGDVNDVQGDLQDFVTENPDVIDTPLDQVVDEVPPGTWGESRWGQFNWG